MGSRKKGECSVRGCKGKKEARGLCQMHYVRRWRTGEIGPAAKLPSRNKKAYAPGAVCLIDGCEKPPKSRGWCQMHYMRWYLLGDPGEAAPRAVWGSWGPYNKEGYVSWHIPKPDGTRQVVYEHQIVMENTLGRPLRLGENVHHKNGVRDDNRPENLELWVKPPRSGQRVEDLVDFVVTNYPELVAVRLARPLLFVG